MLVRSPGAAVRSRVVLPDSLPGTTLLLAGFVLVRLIPTSDETASLLFYSIFFPPSLRFSRQSHDTSGSLFFCAQFQGLTLFFQKM